MSKTVIQLDKSQQNALILARWIQLNHVFANWVSDIDSIILEYCLHPNFKFIQNPYIHITNNGLTAQHKPESSLSNKGHSFLN